MIANPVDVLNPAVEVPGGPTEEWGRVLIDAIDGELAKRALSLAQRSVRVVVGQARALAPRLGTAASALQRAGELLTGPKPPAVPVGSVA